MAYTQLDLFRDVPYAKYNGSPYDRGGADSYYRRSFDPHYYPEGTYKCDRVEMKDMTPDEITAYTAGYRDNEEAGDHKDWG
jgi:hypothetical protein